MPKRFIGMIVASVLLAMAIGTAYVPAQANFGFKLALEPIVDTFTQPIFLTHAGDSSGRLFVATKPGQVNIVKDGQRIPQPFLDIQGRISANNYEQGLLGLAFHPNYASNGLFYLNYSAPETGNTIIAERKVSATDPNRADPDYERLIIEIKQPYTNHNGGMIAFGPDGYLYIGMGDGGSAGDPTGQAQNLRSLLGKILRINVDAQANGKAYAIPADNPFVGQSNAAPEIWSYGWRNPWRFSFDRLTGDKFFGDVGQNAFEEVHYEAANAPAGLNYGWNRMEGLHCYPNSGQTNCNADGKFVLPVIEYGRDFGLSVVGGYVYRGQQFPDMQGVYFYADFGQSRIWALRKTADGLWENAELTQAGFPISSFGEDEAGELYLVDFAGGIYKLIQAQ
jgi:glucose/arabinose dehydrogenase